jgi:hypothetical protein
MNNNVSHVILQEARISDVNTRFVTSLKAMTDPETCNRVGLGGGVT